MVGVTVAELHQHILELCLKHGVTVQWRTSNRGTAYRKERRVSIPLVRSARTYALALHELGHVLGQQSGRRLDQEVQAWQWAKANALVWTFDMQDKLRSCLLSYVKWAERRQRNSTRGFIFIPVSHPIYALAGITSER